ncbi:glycosyltransferase [Flavobacterium sp. NST-5]|uniref:Glycosyltransferase n=1 Tax=Flavobacterium ichthyis TaxID=2698827 RepID=A0ABW9ZC23_9FLAO|nr:glycosyltransferase family A protein [Flavobacterium ichthyis]NBL65329.1 glycosyltransferase [Flavobacterium ichthyis]
MLSVLIPTYNYNIFPLVKNVAAQLEKAKIDFEIICLDDDSKNYNTENQNINSIQNASYEILPKNIGRSAIRNLLAQKASFESLLFLDADVMPKQNDFVAKYLPFLNNEEKVVYGGIEYQPEKPDKNELLRWIYGNSREALSVETRKKNPYISFLTLNFLITKSVFEKVSFNENIPNLRHEDTLFSSDLARKKIKMFHINNPVIHNGLESSEKFLQKSEEALLGLKNLIDNNLIDEKYVKLARISKRLNQWKLTFLLMPFFKNYREKMIKNLLGENPSLFIFDLYRLGYFCQLNQK